MRSKRLCGPGELTNRGEVDSISDRDDFGVGEETDMANQSDMKEMKQG